jgi:putative membrane protein
MLRTSLVLVALIMSTSAGAAPAKKFLTDAIQGDNSEARLGQIISAKGSTAQVRSFGSTLTTDHRAARVQASAVARSIGMTPPTQMAPEAREEMRKLQHLHGRAFDREVRRYMVKDHRTDIGEFAAQVRSGDSRTADLAKAQLPTLRKHLRLAEAISD